MGNILSHTRTFIGFLPDGTRVIGTHCHP
jgi:hypothetical protein